MNPLQKLHKCESCMGKGTDGQGQKCLECAGAGWITDITNGKKWEKGKGQNA